MDISSMTKAKNVYMNYLRTARGIDNTKFDKCGLANIVVCSLGNDYVHADLTDQSLSVHTSDNKSLTVLPIGDQRFAISTSQIKEGVRQTESEIKFISDFYI
jgi:hypothetical protein